eukprot:CAMPEP_0201136838 /NCGR_PEP_ID=MMETSP0850-20130426/55088_1 /ASSEMBLY_ACC=CAM_ASM_000622 /TAXON_ID=183588 /ORGANISM="Pseudo-nitzschia fraudulenta, Strain WWA7" /LENGTH=485 /DNA_ID=CAMNT_0047408163 /DNA_START=272 /DNA_END=1731 /DNA_ORIENTATION=-
MHAPPGTRGFQRPTQPFRRDRRPSNTRPRRRPSRENRAFHGATATPHRASPAGAARSHRARPGTGRTLAGLRNVVLVTASVGVPGPRNGVVSPRETNDGASHGRVGAPLSLSLRAFLGSRGGWSPSKTCVRARPRRGPSLSLSPGLSGFPWWLVAVQNVCAADDDDRRGRVGAGIRQRKGIPPAEADGGETGAAATGKKAPEPNTIPNQFEHDEAEREDTDANPRTRSTPGSQTKRLARGTLCPARDAPRRGPLAGGPDPRQQDVPGRPLDGERAPRARPCRNAATGEDPGGNGRRPHPVTSMPDNNGMVPAKEKSSRNDPSAFQRSFTVEEAGVWNDAWIAKNDIVAVATYRRYCSWIDPHRLQRRSGGAASRAGNDGDEEDGSIRPETSRSLRPVKAWWLRAKKAPGRPTRMASNEAVSATAYACETFRLLAAALRGDERSNAPKHTTTGTDHRCWGVVVGLFFVLAIVWNTNGKLWLVSFVS